MSAPLTLAGLNLESEAAVFVEQQRQFRESVEKMYGHKDLSGDIIAHSISGSIKLMDALALARSVKAAKPKKILEVGSFLGFSTRVLVDASEEFGSSVTSLDPRIRHRIFDDIKNHVTTFNDSDRLTCKDAFLSQPLLDGMYYDYLNYEPRLTRDEADHILNNIEVVLEPFDTFDFAFIDGDHSYIATAENLLLVAQMMEPGSLIVLHDAISWPDVVPAAMDVAAEIDGLDVVGVPGTAERAFYMDWWSKIPGMAERPDQLWNLAGSICDGLCVVKIDDKVDRKAFADQCREYGRAHHRAMEQVRKFQTERDMATQHRDEVVHERDHLRTARAEIEEHRNHLEHERNDLEHERNGLQHERNEIAEHRDHLERERNELIEHRDMLQRERDAIAAHPPALDFANKIIPKSAKKVVPQSVKDRVAQRLRKSQAK